MRVCLRGLTPDTPDSSSRRETVRIGVSNPGQISTATSGPEANVVLGGGFTAEQEAEVTDFDPEYKRSRCYANTRGGCSTSISGEHYISHALIRLYTFDDPDVHIQPTPNYRIPVEIQPKKFFNSSLGGPIGG